MKKDYEQCDSDNSGDCAELRARHGDQPFHVSEKEKSVDHDGFPGVQAE